MYEQFSYPRSFGDPPVLDVLIDGHAQQEARLESTLMEATNTIPESSVKSSAVTSMAAGYAQAETHRAYINHLSSLYKQHIDTLRQLFGPSLSGSLSRAELTRQLGAQLESLQREIVSTIQVYQAMMNLGSEMAPELEIQALFNRMNV